MRRKRLSQESVRSTTQRRARKPASRLSACASSPRARMWAVNAELLGELAHLVVVVGGVEAQPLRAASASARAARPGSTRSSARGELEVVQIRARWRDPDRDALTLGEERSFRPFLALSVGFGPVLLTAQRNVTLSLRHHRRRRSRVASHLDRLGPWKTVASSSVRRRSGSSTSSRSTSGPCGRRRRSTSCGGPSIVPLPDEPTDALEVIEQLARDAEPGLTQVSGGRYFGFVVGGAVPAATRGGLARRPPGTRTPGLALLAPAAAVAEEVAGRWLKELLGIPEHASFALVTGCQMAHATALVAARHHVLARGRPRRRARRPRRRAADPRRRRRQAARHARPRAALRRARHGLRPRGAGRRPGADASSTALREALARGRPGPTIVCAQLGEVNTGACDDLEAIADAAEEAGAWLHVDGAFGLWAAASPSLAAPDRRLGARRLVGDRRAQVAQRPVRRRRRLLRAPRLAPRGARDPLRVPAPRRRRRPRPARLDARALAPRARLHDLRGAALARPPRRRRSSSSAPARGRATLAEALAALPGCEVLNEVVLNQVLFRFEDDEATDAFIAAVQAGGEAWLGGTVWDGRRAVRLSVSCWRTSEDDVARAAAAFAAARAARLRGAGVSTPRSRRRAAGSDARGADAARDRRQRHRRARTRPRRTRASQAWPSGLAKTAREERDPSLAPTHPGHSARLARCRERVTGV